MNRRSIARQPVRHYGDIVHPHEVELPEQDMDLDRRPVMSLAEAAALWCAQVAEERRSA